MFSAPLKAPANAMRPVSNFNTFNSPYTNVLYPNPSTMREPLNHNSHAWRWIPMPMAEFRSQVTRSRPLSFLKIMEIPREPCVR